MKKLIAILCLIALCLPLISCASTLSEAETGKAEETVTKEETKTREEEETDAIIYPEGFSVGYSRVDITTTPLPMYEATAETVHDPIQLTCTAICDGENVALIMGADLKGMEKSVADKSKEIIQKKFGVPMENIMINTTHTHSAHTAGGNSAAQLKWAAYYYKQLPIVVEEALRDLSSAEAYIGVSHTDGITFVRRYLLPDGTYMTNPGDRTVVGHETEADNELRTIRFAREGDKQDVLMINYQTHYGGATGKYPAQVSADFVHPYRETVEEEMDMLFAYISGASGNLNFYSSIPGEKKYSDFVKAIDGFMIATRDALSKEEAAETGTIRSAAGIYTATVLHDSDERVAQAKEVVDAAANEARQSQLVAKYGFASKREATAIVTRAGYGETQDINLSVITCGDLAFAAFPYEMFDTNGKEVRDASPYKMTFISSLTGGGFGYIPSAYAFPHGGYEVYVTRFVMGTGEALVQESVRLLNECKNAG